MEQLNESIAIERPWGVTIAAILAIAGSLFTVLIGAFTAALPPVPAKNGFNYHSMMLGVGVFFIALGALGIVTAVGLFKVRSWARVSILGFAWVMTSIALCGLAFAALIQIPVPKGGGPNFVRNLRPAMFLVYSIPFLIGVWWIIQFTRPTTKAVFDAGHKPGESRRPTSISIIGWLHLIGGPFMVVPLIARLPFLIGGEVVRGWSAALAFVILGGVSLYIGWGLLQLREAARKTAIAYIFVTFAHGLLVGLVPSMHAKMQAFQASMPISNISSSPAILEQGPVYVTLSLLFSFIFGGGMIWLLVKNKPAFDQQSGHVEPSVSLPRAAR